LLQDREHEVFGALFLDSQHRVLAFEELFRGTLDSASIYPREVVKRAILLNSGAIIAVHYVARHIMHLMCPILLCAPRGGAGHISRIYGGLLAT
ncbi:MAG: JAB domain-containing protein, partial [Aeromonas sobria]